MVKGESKFIKLHWEIDFSKNEGFSDLQKSLLLAFQTIWCGCPVKTGILLGEKVLFGVYISKRVVQKMGSWLPHDI